jgi:ketosteroid isomerase-like protein
VPSTALTSLARQVTERWPIGDFSAAIEALSEDVEMSAYLPEGVKYVSGRTQVIRFMIEFGAQWENYRVEPEQFEALDGAVLVSGRQVGTGASSGLEVSEPVFIVLRFRDREITGQHWHVERSQALDAAGLT